MPQESIEMVTMSEKYSTNMVNRSLNEITKVLRIKLQLLVATIILALTH